MWCAWHTGFQPESGAQSVLLSVITPMLEAVMFEASAGQEDGQVGQLVVSSAPSVARLDAVDEQFISMERGASPGSMQAGVLPMSPGSFVQKLNEDLVHLGVAKGPA
jgi:hypothetical protein